MRACPGGRVVRALRLQTAIYKSSEILGSVIKIRVVHAYLSMGSLAGPASRSTGPAELPGESGAGPVPDAVDLGDDGMFVSNPEAQCHTWAAPSQRMACSTIKVSCSAAYSPVG